MKKSSLFIILAFSLIFFTPAFAQTRNNTSASSVMYPAGHRGAVTALLIDEEGRILSAGEDGFVEIWNNRAAEERFQLSPYGIRFMVLRPGKTEITIVESDGFSLNRISAWDYRAKTNLFTLRFRDAVSYINYSASGSFLIVARSGRSGVAFIHSETGELLESQGSPLDEMSGTIALAATGRSERNMICYMSTGVLSYWNLETGTETLHFEVPAGISSPILFGNNRFLGGFDSQGLLILDAVTGYVLAREGMMRQGTLFQDRAEGSSQAPSSGSRTSSAGSVPFYCYSTAGRASTVFRMEIDPYSRLSTTNRISVPSHVPELRVAASADAGNIVLGTDQGSVWLLSRNSARIMDTGNPERIIDAAASSSAIGFISERSALGYIPLDYTLLENNGQLRLESAAGPTGSGAYTGIISEPSILSRAQSYNGFRENGVSQFLLWQPGSGRTVPMLKTISGPPVEANSSQTYLDKLTLRFPLRSAAMMGNNYLFLDTSGTVSVLDRETQETYFSYSAAGSVDAAFIDQNTIIVGRTAVSGSAPFMSINLSTGETVPLSYPAVVGLRVYRGLSGVIYGAAVNQSAAATQTSIMRFDLSNPSESEKLIEYNGEDSSFTMAESGGNLASTLGGSGATLYLAGGSFSVNRNAEPVIIPMERSVGLPEKIFDGGGYWFIVLDGEGSITWYDSRSGKLLAVFKIYPGFWVLETVSLSGGWETVRGRTINK